MGNTFPGGSRSKGGRVFGAGNIRRMIQQHHPDHTKGADHSLAGRPHANSREIARNLRRQKRQENKDNGR